MWIVVTVVQGNESVLKHDTYEEAQKDYEDEIEFHRDRETDCFSIYIAEVKHMITRIEGNEVSQ